MCIRDSLLHKERVVRTVGRLVLGGQDKLAAEETVRMVIQRGQRTVAEAEEPGVNVPLVPLEWCARYLPSLAFARWWIP